ncbi:MAG: class A beta-lactamase-related serine hydrolase, partial [Gemmatimonadetes bacterium]
MRAGGAWGRGVRGFVVYALLGAAAAGAAAAAPLAGEMSPPSLQATPDRAPDTTAAALAARLRARVDATARSARLPALTVVFVRAGARPIVAGGAGGEGTARRYRLGEASSAVTALAAYSLVARGRLSLDDPVDLPTGGRRRAAGLTVRHLLEHRSGLPRLFGLAGGAGLGDAYLSAPPGERFEPSALNDLLLRRVVEAAAGRPYEAVRDELLGPPTGADGAPA